MACAAGCAVLALLREMKGRSSLGPGVRREESPGADVRKAMAKVWGSGVGVGSRTGKERVRGTCRHAADMGSSYALRMRESELVRMW